MFRTLFLNTFLRSPRWMFLDKQKKRIKYILSYILSKNPDIIGLSECFGPHNSKNMRYLLESNGYKTIFFDDRKFLKVNSGLLLAFKPTWIPIHTTIQHFEDSKGVDALANKGFLHVIFKDKTTGKFMNLILTHLQSNYTRDPITKIRQNKKSLKQYRKVQYNQLNQINEYIRKHTSNFPLILMGDLNIDLDYTDNRIHSMMKDDFLIRDLKEPTVSKLCKNGCEKEKKIDYITKIGEGLKYKGGLKIMGENDCKKIIRGKDVDLISDHYAVYQDFSFL
jgi:endonuclease/exonuclease/phosphatase family metal-dependent hydrolase